MIHILKCWPEPFAALVLGVKKFEFRRDDRGFNVGDLLELREWNPKAGGVGVEAFGDFGYTGARAVRVVDYVLRPPTFGVPDGFVIMSLSGSWSESWSPPR